MSCLLSEKLQYFFVILSIFIINEKCVQIIFSNYKILKNSSNDLHSVHLGFLKFFLFLNTRSVINNFINYHRITQNVPCVLYNFFWMKQLCSQLKFNGLVNIKNCLCTTTREFCLLKSFKDCFEIHICYFLFFRKVKQE